MLWSLLRRSPESNNNTKKYFFFERSSFGSFGSHKTRRRRLFLAYLIVAVVFCVEVVSYTWVAWSWSALECSQKTCVRVLLVADPQLIGQHDRPYGRLLPATISAWDADRYLTKTYARAYLHVRPDVVVFLGDLLDEGSRGTDEEYVSYVQRFMGVFRMPYVREYDLVEPPVPARIALPGDNDIGGEGFDPITKHKVERFKKYFGDEQTTVVGHVRFASINPLLSTFSDADRNGNDEEERTVTLALSHLPLITLPTSYVQKILESSKIRVLFTAHHHTAAIIMRDSALSQKKGLNITHVQDSSVYEYDLKDDSNDDHVYEFSVPTCSYRMGTTKMGYGFALIDGTTIKYTVLWTPSRFSQFTFYAIFAFACLCYLGVT